MRKQEQELEMEMEMDCSANTMQVVFVSKWQVRFGKAVYLVGNTFDLGEWNVNNGIRMEHYPEENWATVVRMPIDSAIEYKFFVSDYEAVDPEKVEWENINGNRRKYVSLPKPPLPIKICSANIRYLTNKDKGNVHWDARKGRIVEYVNKASLDIMGVQQATFPQRQYLEGFLSNNYRYFGRARDLHKDQECGIFVRDNFEVIDDEYCWISETREPGMIGYGAKLPRYFTSLVIAPKFSETSHKRIPCILVINAHLDHMSELARKKGLEHILEKCIQKANAYQDNKQFILSGFVVMGDFNQEESHSIFDTFRKDNIAGLRSMREILRDADKSFTFNGFSNKYLLKISEYVLNEKLTIDHMFVSFTKESPYQPLEFQVVKPQSEREILSDHYFITGLFGRKPLTEKGVKK